MDAGSRLMAVVSYMLATILSLGSVPSARTLCEHDDGCLLPLQGDLF